MESIIVSPTETFVFETQQQKFKCSRKHTWEAAAGTPNAGGIVISGLASLPEGPYCPYCLAEFLEQFIGIVEEVQ